MKRRSRPLCSNQRNKRTVEITNLVNCLAILAACTIAIQIKELSALRQLHYVTLTADCRSIFIEDGFLITWRVIGLEFSWEQLDTLCNRQRIGYREKNLFIFIGKFICLFIVNRITIFSIVVHVLYNRNCIQKNFLARRLMFKKIKVGNRIRRLIHTNLANQIV